MVARAIDAQCNSPHFTNNPPEISKQIIAKLRLDQRPTAGCGEDEVKQYVAGCVSHASFVPPGLSSPVGTHPRLAPWAVFFRRLAASQFRIFGPRGAVIDVTLDFFQVSGRTNLVNSRDLKTFTCIPFHSSAINNSPRADVWLSRSFF